MKITFVSSSSVDQISAWSGTPYHMFRELKKTFPDINNIKIQPPSKKITGFNELSHVEKVKEYGNFISKKIMRDDSDVVLCLGHHLVPYLQIAKPIIIWHDSSWFSSSRLDAAQFKYQYPILYEQDINAFEKSALIIFAADWVKNQVEEFYGISPNKMMVIPFGANIDPVYEPQNSYLVRKPEPCQLTFIALNWELKGLNLAYYLNKELNDSGVETILNVIGCNISLPPLRKRIANDLRIGPYSPKNRFLYDFFYDKKVNKIGFLDKNNPVEKKKLYEILSKSHFLIHPAKFECYGLVLAEANAFGVPAIAINHYGPKSIIKQGKNGYVFDEPFFGIEASHSIRELILNYEKYLRLSQSTYNEYLERLNWPVSIKKLKDTLVRIF